MANAVLVQVADAVTALLNTPGAFSQSFTAKRSYPTWKVPLDKICGLRVEVVPSRHFRSEKQTRASTDYGCRLIIVIREKFWQADREDESRDGRPISNEAIDANVLLVEEIHDYLSDIDQCQLSDSQGLSAAWDETVIQNTYIDDHLQNNSQFTGIVRVTYGATKDQ